MPLLVYPGDLKFANDTSWRFPRCDDLGCCLALHKLVHLLLRVGMPLFARQLVQLVGTEGVFFIVNPLERCLRSFPYLEERVSR